MPKKVTKKSAPSKLPATKGVKKSAPVKKAAVKKPSANHNGSDTEPTGSIDHGFGRKVVYPKVEVVLYSKDSPNGPMTADLMKKLLGWTEEGKTKFGEDYHIIDNNGAKVRLEQNITNREFDRSLGRTWEGEILNGNWVLNGETMIIGRTGLDLDIQHRGVGLILAWQEWLKDKKKWPRWEKEEPYIECIVVFGISEESHVVDTINTGKPRSLADVLFRGGDFDGIPRSKRGKIAKAAAFAITMLGHRTASWEDAFSNRRTHSENVDFFHRHSTLKECIKFCYECAPDADDQPIITLGYAAALLFLMGSSTSDGKAYLSEGSGASDRLLNWDMMDLAKEFWRLILEVDQKMFPVRAALSQIVLDNDAENATNNEIIGVLIKAWQYFSVGKPLDESKLLLEYKEKDGVRRLVEYPRVSEIDFGNSGTRKEPKPPKEKKAKKTAKGAADVKAQAQAQPTKGTKKKVPVKGASAGHGGRPKEGDTVWVLEDPVDASWSGQIVEIYPLENSGGKHVARIHVSKGFSGAGKTIEAPYEQCQHEKPLITD